MRVKKNSRREGHKENRPRRSRGNSTLLRCAVCGYSMEEVGADSMSATVKMQKSKVSSRGGRRTRYFGRHFSVTVRRQPTQNEEASVFFIA